MDLSTFENLPYVIFEAICSNLHPNDIARLEQTSGKILATIQELNLWKKVAVALIKHSDVPAVPDVLKYMKLREVKCPKYYKIIVGLTVVTMKFVDGLGCSMNYNESIALFDYLVNLEDHQRSTWLNKSKARCILDCYGEALLKVRCGNVDVMNHIFEFKGDVNRLLVITFGRDASL